MCLPSESWSGSGATQGLWVGAALIRTATLLHRSVEQCLLNQACVTGL